MSCGWHPPALAQFGLSQLNVVFVGAQSNNSMQLAWVQRALEDIMHLRKLMEKILYTILLHCDLLVVLLLIVLYVTGNCHGGET